MNKSQVIYLNTDTSKVTDKYIKVKLEQDIDTLEVLSMNIDTNDIYTNFNSEFGVLVGRVVGNDSVGVPNAKISVFIPLSDSDASDPDIESIYPYKTPRDKNRDGKRYNLLPRVGKKSVYDGVYKPAQPFGSFPIKEEVNTNPHFLDVYKKYYKYTALTNGSGDYMIYGVPVGTQIVHMSVDITDIGIFSMSPASMITNLGYSADLFIGKTKIKPNNDLNDLPHIETQEITVDVIPFWGDVNNFEIGITRQDFKIRAKLDSTFVIFGSVFTDGDGQVWGENYNNTSEVYFKELYQIKDAKNGNVNQRLSAKRTGSVTEKIYYYPSIYTDNDITSGRVGADDMLVLDKSKYSVYREDGMFAFIISCNRDKIITSQNGQRINVPDDYSGGIYTQFRGFITFEINDLSIPTPNRLGDEGGMAGLRYKLKVPQGSNYNPIPGKTFTYDTVNPDNDADTVQWRNQHAVFSGGSFYSVAKYHGTVYNKTQENSQPVMVNGFFPVYDVVNNAQWDLAWNVGVIATDVQGEIPSNLTSNNNSVFGSEWLNFSLHFMQVGYLTESENNLGETNGCRSTTNFTKFTGYNANGNPLNWFYYKDNGQKIGADQTNTKWFARSDIHMTDFILVPKQDIKTINDFISSQPAGKLGFKQSEIPTLTNIYRHGGYGNGEVFHYLGRGTNCIKYLYDLGII